MSENKTESELIDVCQELGGIAESNCHFTSGLAHRLEAGNVQLLEMKVGDLLSLSREYNKFFNGIHS